MANKKKLKLAKLSVILATMLSLTLNPMLVCAEDAGTGAGGTSGSTYNGVGFDTSDKNLGGANIGDGIGTSTGSPTLDNANGDKCVNANILPRMIQTTCWTCLFPMVAMGIPFNFGGTADEVGMPEDRSKKVACMCEDRGGMPYMGTLYSLWVPAKLVEFVREPGCSPTLMGMNLGNFSKTGTGKNESRTDEETEDTLDKTIFMHYHYFAYPILAMTRMMQNTPNCIKDSYVDIDLLFPSEVDPTWNDDTIAFFTNTETLLFNNPVGVIACLPDAISSTIFRKPISALFWCAGSWGSMYPFSGNVDTTDEGLSGSSLMTAKMLAALHRRGFLKITYGDDAVCVGQYSGYLPKSQYKISMLFPVPETKSTHAIGEATLRWGTARKVPVTGEDYVYLLWNWNDCCLSVLGPGG